MSEKITDYLIYLTVLCLPLYLVKFNIFWIPLNVLEILIYITFIWWLFFGFKDKKVFNLSIWLPIILILIGVTISVFISIDLETSAGIWKSWFIAPIILFVVLVSQVREKNQINNLIFSLTLSGFFVALIALYYWLTGDLTYDGRLKAFYLSANFLAMYLSSILILSLFLYRQTKKKLFKILLVINYLLLVLIIYLTYSYGAFLGLFFALLYILTKQENLKLKIIFVLLIIFVLILQIPNYKLQGMLDLSYPSLESRLVIWQSAFEILKDNWIIGIGLGNFQEYYLSYQSLFDPYPEWAVPQPHNLFLAFWLQAGIIGLIGFIWLLIYFFKKINPKGILGFILIGAMIYVLVHGLIDTTYWKNDLAVLFWLITALGYRACHLTD